MPMLYGRLGALVTAFVVGVVMAVAPVAPKPAGAATADTATVFRMTWGASVTEGTITWYNRSVNIRGYVKAVSTSKQAMFWGIGTAGSSFCLPDPETRTTPAGTTRSFNFGMYCDIEGGFDEIDVYLNDDIGTLLIQVCFRSGCLPPEPI
jgi:hypothetical protein